ncbi:glycosyltransferase family 4 protein [Vibrio sp. PID17_43]|uniref:glycosyltransferase family 4 protein n=1 Tax=Vibrio sp. PID17_43 TaxID=1583451 RepID=UPI000C000D8A|nr:glycosyltransferase [Vibrio sp. PID17_43]PHJ40209.1 hypothetical protein AK965_18065 [Vibrio sp. PID17_43]
MKVGTAFCDYENYHAFSVLEGLENLKKYHFLEAPSWRKGKNWELNESKKLGFFSVKALRRVLKSDYVIFWGIFNPFPTMLFYFIFAVIFRKEVFICSEGFKSEKKGLGKKLISFLMAFAKQEKISVLCIGNGANSDYKSIGFNNVNFYKFGFFEEYNSVGHITISDKYSNLENRTLRILYVGQLIDRKGILDFVTKLDDVKRDLIIDIAGDGELMGGIRAAKSFLPPNVKVNLHGYCCVEKLHDLYSSADIFLLPSKYEGWGVVINQAIHYKLPLLLAANVRSGEGFLFDNNGAIFNGYSQALNFISSIDEESIIRMANYSCELSKIWNVEVARTRLRCFINNGMIYDSGPLAIYTLS